MARNSAAKIEQGHEEFDAARLESVKSLQRGESPEVVFEVAERIGLITAETRAELCRVFPDFQEFIDAKFQRELQLGADVKTAFMAAFKILDRIRYEQRLDGVTADGRRLIEHPDGKFIEILGEVLKNGIDKKSGSTNRTELRVISTQLAELDALPAANEVQQEYLDGLQVQMDDLDRNRGEAQGRRDELDRFREGIGQERDASQAQENAETMLTSAVERDRFDQLLSDNLGDGSSKLDRAEIEARLASLGNIGKVTGAITGKPELATKIDRTRVLDERREQAEAMRKKTEAFLEQKRREAEERTRILDDQIADANLRIGNAVTTISTVTPGLATDIDDPAKILKALDKLQGDIRELELEVGLRDEVVTALQLESEKHTQQLEFPNQKMGEIEARIQTLTALITDACPEAAALVEGGKFSEAAELVTEAGAAANELMADTAKIEELEQAKGDANQEAENLSKGPEKRLESWEGQLVESRDNLWGALPSQAALLEDDADGLLEVIDEIRVKNSQAKNAKQAVDLLTRERGEIERGFAQQRAMLDVYIAHWEREINFEIPTLDPLEDSTIEKKDTAENKLASLREELAKWETARQNALDENEVKLNARQAELDRLIEEVDALDSSIADLIREGEFVAVIDRLNEAVRETNRAVTARGHVETLTAALKEIETNRSAAIADADKKLTSWQSRETEHRANLKTANSAAEEVIDDDPDLALEMIDQSRLLVAQLQEANTALQAVRVEISGIDAAYTEKRNELIDRRQRLEANIADLQRELRSASPAVADAVENKDYEGALQLVAEARAAAEDLIRAGAEIRVHEAERQNVEDLYQTETEYPAQHLSFWEQQVATLSAERDNAIVEAWGEVTGITDALRTLDLSVLDRFMPGMEAVVSVYIADYDAIGTSPADYGQMQAFFSGPFSNLVGSIVDVFEQFEDQFVTRDLGVSIGFEDRKEQWLRARGTNSVDGFSADIAMLGWYSEIMSIFESKMHIFDANFVAARDRSESSRTKLESELKHFAETVAPGFAAEAIIGTETADLVTASTDFSNAYQALFVGSAPSDEELDSFVKDELIPYLNRIQMGMNTRLREIDTEIAEIDTEIAEVRTEMDRNTAESEFHNRIQAIRGEKVAAKRDEIAQIRAVIAGIGTAKGALVARRAVITATLTSLRSELARLEHERDNPPATPDITAAEADVVTAKQAVAEFVTNNKPRIAIDPATLASLPPDELEKLKSHMENVYIAKVILGFKEGEYVTAKKLEFRYKRLSAQLRPGDFSNVPVDPARDGRDSPRFRVIVRQMLIDLCRDSLLRELAEEAAGNSTYNGQLKALLDAETSAKDHLKSLKEQHLTDTARLATVGAEIARVNGDISSNQLDLNGVDAEIAEKDSELSEERKKLGAAIKEVSRLQTMKNSDIVLDRTFSKFDPVALRKAEREVGEARSDMEAFADCESYFTGDAPSQALAVISQYSTTASGIEGVAFGSTEKLSGRIRDLKRDNDQLSRSIKRDRDRIAKLTGDQDESIDKLPDAERRVNQTEANHRAKVAEVTRIEAELTQARRATPQDNAVITRLSLELKDARDKAANAARQLDTDRFQVTRLRDRVNRLQREIQQLNASVAEDESKLSRQSGELNGLEVQLPDLKSLQKNSKKFIEESQKLAEQLRVLAKLEVVKFGAGDSNEIAKELERTVSNLKTLDPDDSRFTAQPLIQIGTRLREIYSSIDSTDINDSFDQAMSRVKQAITDKEKALKGMEAAREANRNLTDVSAAKRVMEAMVDIYHGDKLSAAEKSKIATLELADKVELLQVDKDYAELAQMANADLYDVVADIAFKQKLIDFKFKIGDDEVQPFKGMSPEDFVDWATIEKHFNSGRFNLDNGFYLLAGLKRLNPGTHSIQSVRVERKLKELIAKELGVEDRMSDGSINNIVNEAFDEQMGIAEGRLGSFIDLESAKRSEWTYYKVYELNTRYKALKERRKKGEIDDDQFQDQLNDLISEAEDFDIMDRVSFSADTFLSRFWNSPYAQWGRDGLASIGKFTLGKTLRVLQGGAIGYAYGIGSMMKTSLLAPTVGLWRGGKRALNNVWLFASSPFFGFRRNWELAKQRTGEDVAALKGYVGNEVSWVMNGAKQGFVNSWGKTNYEFKRYADTSKVNTEELEKRAEGYKEKSTVQAAEVNGEKVVNLSAYKKKVEEMDEAAKKSKKDADEKAKKDDESGSLNTATVAA